jgi:cell division protein ZapA (FtsZ GTPase activity inhibitor)
VESVQINIFGRPYTLKGGDDPEYTRKLAVYVDEQMKEIERGTGTMDPLRVAILTSLTLADDLHRAREQREAVENTAGNAVKRLLELTAAVKQGA